MDIKLAIEKQKPIKSHVHKRHNKCYKTVEIFPDFLGFSRILKFSWIVELKMDFLWFIKFQIKRVLCENLLKCHRPNETAFEWTCVFLAERESPNYFSESFQSCLSDFLIGKCSMFQLSNQKRYPNSKKGK